MFQRPPQRRQAVPRVTGGAGVLRLFGYHEAARIGKRKTADAARTHLQRERSLERPGPRQPRRKAQFVSMSKPYPTSVTLSRNNFLIIYLTYQRMIPMSVDDRPAQAKEEIEITPQMTDAGVDACPDGGACTHLDVAAVYRAMELVRRQGKRD